MDLQNHCSRLIHYEIPWNFNRLEQLNGRIVRHGQQASEMRIYHFVGAGFHRAAGGYLRAGRFARLESVGKVDELLAAASDEPVSDALWARLAGLWENHREPLLRSLEARMRDRTRNPQSFLAQRRDRELADIRAVLGELQRAIEQELAADEAPLQLDLWSDGEREQRQRDREHLRTRLAVVPAELAVEERRIRERYAEPAPRLFPVAVSYLVPEGVD